MRALLHCCTCGRFRSLSCRFVTSVGDQAGAAKAPPADTGDSARALVNMIKKEEITVNADLGVKIPVSCTPPCACAGWCCAPLLYRR